MKPYCEAVHDSRESKKCEKSEWFSNLLGDACGWGDNQSCANRSMCACCHRVFRLLKRKLLVMLKSNSLMSESSLNSFELIALTPLNQRMSCHVWKSFPTLALKSHFRWVYRRRRIPLCKAAHRNFQSSAQMNRELWRNGDVTELRLVNSVKESWYDH